MKNAHAAVVDDGKNEGVFHISSKQFIKRNYDICSLSHGTICAAIIKKYFPSACFSSLKILSDERKKGTIKSMSLT